MHAIFLLSLMKLSLRNRPDKHEEPKTWCNICKTRFQSFSGGEDDGEVSNHFRNIAYALYMNYCFDAYDAFRWCILFYCIKCIIWTAVLMDLWIQMMHFILFYKMHCMDYCYDALMDFVTLNCCCMKMQRFYFALHLKKK